MENQLIDLMNKERELNIDIAIREISKIVEKEFNLFNINYKYNVIYEKYDEINPNILHINLIVTMVEKHHFKSERIIDVEYNTELKVYTTLINNTEFEFNDKTFWITLLN